ncbi:MAG: hypothetical protein LBV58_04635, partial [Acholeplasmatales bacterium]|nr:hypothetical protein [Acholeplasmatales bacterium]
MAILGYCSIINMLVLYTIRAIDGTCKTDQKKRYKLNICKYFFVRYGLSTKKGDKKGIVDEYNHSTISQKALIMQILNYAYWLICLVIIIIDAINP